MEKQLLSVATIRDWLRARTAILTAYRLLPEKWRVSMSRAVVGQMMRGVRFKSLPPADVPLLPVQDPYPLVGGDAGINLFAYFRGRFGLAEAARLYARALIEDARPVALNDIDLGLPHDFNEGAFAHRIANDAPFDATIIFVNPDYLQAAFDHLGERLRRRPLIACWFWELEIVPDAWHPALLHVDGIVVASSFIENAFRKITDKPICRVPLPLFDDPDSGVGRASFGLDEKDFVFLASFDFHSWFERKNPLAVVEAFKSAFSGGSERARLVLKTSNGSRYPDGLTKLLRVTRSEPRIMVRDEVLDRPHMSALQRCCDAYVSLHCAEGFGLGLAECMKLAKPVIATGWSGNMEFMNGENSCLVGYRLVDVPDTSYLHAAGQRWAEPNVAEASEWMRRLVDNRSLGRQIGERARSSVLRELAPSLASSRLATFVDDLKKNGISAHAATAVTGARQ